MPVREETQRERAERLAQERVEYAHVIVDEAQDLTPMQWRMVGRRGRHATWTIVGDPAQSSWSDPDEAAQARDEALGTRPRRRFELTVNYRNPAEIAELASKVLALAMPGSESPRAVRSTGVEPRFAVARDALGDTVRAEAARLLERVDGTVGVVVAMRRREEARRWLDGLGDRVVALGSLEAKGLEYDATVVVSPAEIADESPAGLRVLYVALTRATQQLTVVSAERDEPDAEGSPTCCGTEPTAASGGGGKYPPVMGMAPGDPFVSLDVAPARSSPGPNLSRFERPLAARRAWRVGVMNVREALVTRCDGGLFAARVSLVWWNSFSGWRQSAVNKTSAIRGGYHVLSGRCDDRTARFATRLKSRGTAMATAPSVSYSMTIRLEVPAGGTAVSQLTGAVESHGGLVTGLDVTASGHERLRIDVTIAATSTAHAEEIVEQLRHIEGVTLGKVSDRTFLMHLGGKIEMASKHPIRTRDDLSMVYTPGVARVCMAIAENPEDARRLTIKRNSVAVVTDGSAVLGLGNIGPKAALPVMEGKAALFKRFAGIDAWPLCLDTQDTDAIVEIVKAIAPASPASTSRTSPRPAASRSRPGCARPSTSPSSTTTSTAPPSWCSQP